MADSLAFNKIAGAVLATGLVIFGLQNLSSELFKKSPPTKAGYLIAVQDTSEAGAAPADVPPDWGTVLPKADISAGQAITAKCASCHQFDAGDTPSTGPGLYGVVGRPPGTQAKYVAAPGYDSAMQDFAKTHTAWTYDLLYQFLKAPGQFMPGTKMTFVGLPEAKDRINVIAYLRSNGSPNYPIPAPAPAKPATPAAGAASNATASNATAATNAAAPASNAAATNAAH
ncbi:MAG TPA: cytochrome c family protein [Caulobacteraceae bacterium]|nr:cytochrome c family protein [Caulobacteraceae bacterium]